MRLKEAPMKGGYDDFAAWRRLFEELQHELNKNRQDRLSIEEVYDACFILISDHPEFEHPLYLYSIEPNFDVFYAELKDYPFEYNKVQVESPINELSISLIQERAQIKADGIIWVLHKYDLDPFPSSPHAHNIKNGLKLHLGNGQVYKKTEAVDKLHKKTFLRIREEFEQKGFKMPELEF
jgi:hypothetical protein